MILYPLGSPPSEPGIYILKHLPTGQLYAGRSVNLRRRWAEWKSLFQTKIGRTSVDMMVLARATKAEEWVFGVLKLCPKEDLDRLEARAIERMMAAGICLNRQVALPTRPPTPLPGSPALSVVTGPTGPMTRREIAVASGMSRQSVKEKLQKLRRKYGITDMTLEEFQRDRRHASLAV